ncbi:MAG: PKD domain-containing protein, partial [Flavobacteriales bacterium]
EGQCLMGSSYMPPAIAPKPFPSLLPNAGCAPLDVMFADTTGGGTTTLSWNLGDGTTSTESSLTHTYNTPGTYDVYLQIRSTDGCTGDTLLANAVIVHPSVNGQITATPDPVNAEQPNVQLNGTAAGNIVSWWWDMGVATPGTSDQQSVPVTFPPIPGDYPVILVVTSVEGCVDTVYSMVTVIDPGVIQMPNVFSPNADGSNDRFIPIDYKGAPGTLTVFNRWGLLVFSTTSLAQGWSGSGAPDGTYFYIVTPNDAAGTKLSGYVTLVR